MKLTVALAVLVGTLILACSTVTPAPAEPTPRIYATAEVEPTPDIDATVEARVAQERAVDATVEAKVSGTLSAPEPKTPSTTQAVCKLTGGETVQSGWTGEDTGNNSCNSCFCTNGVLGCTKMACPAHIGTQVPTATYPIAPTVTPKPEPTPTRVRPTWTPVSTPWPTRTPAPTPTPMPTVTPTPSHRYSMAFIEDLVFDSLLGCLVQYDWIEWMPAKNKAWETSYLGNGLWITEVIYDNQTFGTGAVVGSLDMGMWHTYESTGAVVPFDGGAKTYSICAR